MGQSSLKEFIVCITLIVIQILQFIFLMQLVQGATSTLSESYFQISSSPSIVHFVGRITIGLDLCALRESLV